MRFSILIPTRNRLHTIKSTIETVLENQKSYSDFEVIVSDNSDKPSAIGDILNCFGENIKILSQSGNLSMSDNWEAALSFAQGEYVIVIGDDDGLIPHSLSSLEGIIASTEAQVVSWPWIHYAWPNTLPTEHGCDIYMPAASNTFSIRHGRPILQALAACETCNYSDLPCLYNSAIHRSVIQKIRSRLGRVFIGKSPDVTSGILIAYTCKTWIRLNFPLSIVGTSPTSNGSAHLQRINAKSSEIVNDFEGLNAGKISLIEWIPGCNTLYDIVSEDLARCHSSYFPKDESLKVNRRNLIEKCFLSFLADTPEEYAIQYDKILCSTNNDRRVRKWFTRRYSQYDFITRPFVEMHEWWSCEPGLTSAHLTLNARKHGISDVLECARFCETVYNMANSSASSSPREIAHSKTRSTSPTRLARLIQRVKSRILRFLAQGICLPS